MACFNQNHPTMDFTTFGIMPVLKATSQQTFTMLHHQICREYPSILRRSVITIRAHMRTHIHTGAWGCCSIFYMYSVDTRVGRFDDACVLDGRNWTVTPSTPVISHVGKGSFSFDQVADPSPLTVGAVAYMAYDGDNNGCRDCSHAAIGLATAPAV